jgi:integrase
MFYTTQTGLKNIFMQLDHLRPATPLTIKDLFTLVLSLDLTKKSDAEFWFATVLGFQGLLRASEFVAGRLKRGHFRFRNWGILLTVPFSKKNLRPVQIGLVARNDALCPVRAAAHLFKNRGGVSAEAIIYPHCYSTFNNALQRRCQQAGITKTGISSHSLRRGGATALFRAGVRAESIMAHGRWSSDAYKAYIDFDSAEELQQLPTALLLRATFR